MRIEELGGGEFLEVFFDDCDDEYDDYNGDHDDKCDHYNRDHDDECYHDNLGERMEELGGMMVCMVIMIILRRG